PDGSQIACGGLDNVVRLYHARAGTVLAWTSNHGVPVTAVGFTKDGKQLITGSLDGKARVWDAEGDKQLREIDAIDTGLGAITSLSVHRDGQSVALANYRPEDPDGGPDLQVWDVPARRVGD